MLIEVSQERLAAAGFEPPDNICAKCHHHGGNHDLSNWCLVCPRPEVTDFRGDWFAARIRAGWDYFASMTENERWTFGIAALASTPETRDEETA